VKAWPSRVISLHRAAAVLLALLVAAMLAVMSEPWTAPFGIAFGIAYYVLATRRYRRRVAKLVEPFPEAWRRTLRDKVHFYRRLEDRERARFETNVTLFLLEQRMVAAHGATLDDETRLLIAASAAMLCHGLPDWEWPAFRDIVVYPRAFDDGYQPGHHGTIAGMVHAQGPILISRRDLRHGFKKPFDGHNVALHELAHVMDFADGRADGLPADVSFISTAPWVEMVANRLKRVRRRKGPQALRQYAGTNEAELFAVAVEAFFERPRDLKAKDPDLYRMLADYFAQDPALDA
jgi:Mlc titration factor MtfA (ptsG expression regulator)